MPTITMTIEEYEALMDLVRGAEKPAAKVTRKVTKAKKAPRKVSKYAQTYGKHFKAISSKYKKKDGSWKQDGFKKTQAAAHKATRKEMKK